MTTQPILIDTYYLFINIIDTSKVAFVLIIMLLTIAVWSAFIMIRKNKNSLAQKTRLDQKLIANTIVSQEKERKRIASNIHDDFCSRLSLIKLMLHNNESEKLPEELFIQLDETYHAARTLSHHLNSPVLDRLGLLEAVRDYIRPLYGILKIEMHILQVFTQRLAKHIELHLFRIIQETITNIIKHANASIIQIDVHFSRQLAALRITDNGVGFNAEDTAEGAGLNNIKIRVAMLKGSYRMRSEPQQGTSLLIMIPLENNPDRSYSLTKTQEDEFDYAPVGILPLHSKKQLLHSNGTNFIFSFSRRRKPFYKRYRKHHSSKNKAQSTL